MPPEQARGTAVDRRADSWAFGCVLFEMLAGNRAFDGESTTDVLAAVIRAEPDWTALPATTPAPIRRLLKRCLEKDRKRRLPDIGVARLEIDDALAAPEAAAAAGPATPAQRSLAPWIVAAVAVLAAAGAIWWALRAPSPEPFWTGTMIGASRSAFGPRLSPDGQLLAFLSFEEQLPQLSVMKPNGGSWTVLTHDRDRGYLTTAAWAPDGSKIYFDRAFGLPLGVYSIPPLGGDPRLLLEDAFSPEPLRDGSLIVLKLGDRGDLQAFQFWPESGKLEPLPAYMPLTDITPMLRSFPDGKQVVYYGMSEAGRSQNARLMILDLASHKTHEVPQAPRLKDATSWSPLEVSADGKFVYMLAAQNDTRSLVKIPAGMGGKPVPILTFPLTAAPLSLDLARDGSMYLDQGLWPTSVLSFDENGGAMQEYSMPYNRGATVLRDGSVLVALFDNGKTRLDVFRPGAGLRTLLEISEDCGTPATTFGAYIAFQIGSGDRQRNALAGLRDGRVIRRYQHKADNSLIASPDGKTLYYSFDGAIWSQAVDGGEPKRITEGIDVAIDPAGKYLYVKRAGKGILSMVRMPVGGGTEEGLPVPEQFHIADTAFSPSAVDAHGRILVAVLNAHSFYYHTAILDPASKSLKVIPVPIDGDAAMPGWAPDGRILGTGKRYFLSMWHYQRSAGFK
jgi:Tol biopolymer transport system component